MMPMEIGLKWETHYAPAGVLCCPKCDGGNLHQGDVGVEFAGEYPWVKISFSCEHRPETSVLAIHQHKGNTLVEWL